MDAELPVRQQKEHRTANGDSVTGPTIINNNRLSHPYKSPAVNSAQERYIVVHRVDCDQDLEHVRHETRTHFLDVPRLLAGASRPTALRGQHELPNLDIYLEDHPHISFATCITYSCNDYHEKIRDEFERQWMPPMDDDIAAQAKPYFYILRRDAEQATPVSECIVPSSGLKRALAALHAHHPEYLQKWNEDDNFQYPYLQLFHCKSLFTGVSANKLSTSHQYQLRVLSSYFEKRLAAEYAEAEALFEQGLVSKKHWAKLFRPNEMIVTMSKHGPLAYLSTSCPLPEDDILDLPCWSWGFDGKFIRTKHELTIDWPSRSDVVHITELAAYPLRLDKTGLEDRLRRRGQVFWTCRERRYINYDVSLQGIEVQIANLRYMVDMKTYKLMHGSMYGSLGLDELPDSKMHDDDPPQEPFTLLLPATIKGFGFHNKKWNELLVEHVSDIEWNKEAFDHSLVLAEEKKELIRALVTVHIGKKNGIGTNETVRADFMTGKGEGLLILLHGGPGTGKTLTAESVAEFAERPLYRVTCGDIGTDPESVEKYLESVLFIGSTWGCVVLLDEADVFLEERTKLDLDRNALVSVFLRVLEYYDGILILTSNRIGTFDEAFKSRVQLALHYPPLDANGRWEVWRNFFQLLEDGGEDVNYDEINKKLRVIARNELNGRQIRNTVNTARQLARYRKETLRYNHVAQAIRNVNEFEKYVTDLRGETEEYARDLGNRNDVGSPSPD